jgi:hypothetical protein
VLYFKARNGTYKRVPQIPNSGFNGVNGGMTVYYMQDGLYNFQQTSKVQAFQPGFRMFIGDVNARTKDEAERFRQLTFTCLDNINTRDPQTLDFPTQPCKTGIMTAVRFPTYVSSSTSINRPSSLTHLAAGMESTSTRQTTWHTCPTPNTDPLSRVARAQPATPCAWASSFTKSSGIRANLTTKLIGRRMAVNRSSGVSAMGKPRSVILDGAIANACG